MRAAMLAASLRRAAAASAACRLPPAACRQPTGLLLCASLRQADGGAPPAHLLLRLQPLVAPPGQPAGHRGRQPGGPSCQTALCWRLLLLCVQPLPRAALCDRCIPLWRPLQATIYNCQPSGEMQPLQAYIDQDVSRPAAGAGFFLRLPWCRAGRRYTLARCAAAPHCSASRACCSVPRPPAAPLPPPQASEEFFVCARTVEPTSGAPLLLLAGKKGLLLVVNPATGTLETCLEGHGSSINDVAVHPGRPHLVATASRDQSLRLWNVRTR